MFSLTRSLNIKRIMIAIYVKNSDHLLNDYWILLPTQTFSNICFVRPWRSLMHYPQITWEKNRFLSNMQDQTTSWSEDKSKNFYWILNSTPFLSTPFYAKVEFTKEKCWYMSRSAIRQFTHPALSSYHLSSNRIFWFHRRQMLPLVCFKSSPNYLL